MIVLISGWAGSRTSLIPLELGLRVRLDRRVTRADVGFGFGCIRESAERVADQLRALTLRRGERIDLVGYSMGGLVATWLLKCLDRGETVRSVVTLGTPHRGSPAIRLARGILDRVSASLAQMMPGSEFLEMLACAPLPSGTRVVSIASSGDTLVPPLSAELPRTPGHYTRLLSGVSHLGLLTSREALDALEALLAQRRMLAAA